MYMYISRMSNNYSTRIDLLLNVWSVILLGSFSASFVIHCSSNETFKLRQFPKIINHN